MFVFEDLSDFAKWLDQCQQKLSGKAGNEKGAALQFTKGQMFELQNLSQLIKDGSIVIKTVNQQPEPKRELVVKEEKKEERPSGSNNDFLRWVRQHYPPRKYQQACAAINSGMSEEEARRMLSEGSNENT